MVQQEAEGNEKGAIIDGIRKMGMVWSLEQEV